MDSALEAHLGGAALDRLDHPTLDLLHAEQVGVAAQVERERPLRERAEPAFERADVRVVDVAIGDPRDDLADGLAAQVVRHLSDRRHLGAARREQRHELVDVGFLTQQHAGERLADRAAGAR